MNTPDHPENPFFEHWTTPDAVPPFASIRPEHFAPAYARAFAEHDAEIATVANQTESPNFYNTIVALENSGRALARLEYTFNLLTGAHSDDALLAVEREIAPQEATHWNTIHTNTDLFRRIAAVHPEAIEGIGVAAVARRAGLDQLKTATVEAVAVETNTLLTRMKRFLRLA